MFFRSSLFMFIRESVILLGILGFQYCLYDQEYPRPHRYSVALEYGAPTALNMAPVSVWTLGAPLRHQVDSDTARRDYLEYVPISGVADPWNYPVSLLIHLADSDPSNFTVLKAAYSVFLFIAGALILNKYIVPYF